MKLVDSLLLAPLGFCLGGSAAGVFLDIGFSQLCVGISFASAVTLSLYWVLDRLGRRTRLREFGS